MSSAESVQEKRALGEITSDGGCIVAAAVYLIQSLAPDRQKDLTQKTPES